MNCKLIFIKSFAEIPNENRGTFGLIFIDITSIQSHPYYKYVIVLIVELKVANYGSSSYIGRIKISRSNFSFSYGSTSLEVPLRFWLYYCLRIRTSEMHSIVTHHGSVSQKTLT